MIKPLTIVLRMRKKTLYTLLVQSVFISLVVIVKVLQNFHFVEKRKRINPLNVDSFRDPYDVRFNGI